MALSSGSNVSLNPLKQIVKAGIDGDQRSMITMSDDNAMLKQIMETHAPDGREVNVKPLLHLVKDILNRAKSHVDSVKSDTPHMAESIEDKTHNAAFVTMLDSLSYMIDRISRELSYKALSGGDAHSTTISILNLLSTFSWDAKLVLTLAAFAFNCGELWLLAQIYTSNQLANSMAILRQLPFIMESTGNLKSRFEALNNLIRAMMEVTGCVVQLKDLPSAYISQDEPALSTAMTHVPIAVYWTIRSIIACAALIISLSSMGHEFMISIAEAWELSTMGHKLKNIYENLQKQLFICNQHVEERRNVKADQLLQSHFDKIHTDNMKILKVLIYAKDDILQLLDGPTKRRVNLEVLRRKNVLLLISGLDISPDVLAILEQIYNYRNENTSRFENQYKVVWIPIVDSSIQWTDATQKQYESLQSNMPWYSAYHPRYIHRVVIRFIKEKWHFRNKPIIVVLDPQGKVVCPNAIHLMWIWGSSAFPFTSSREEALWREETWRLELLIDGIDPQILTWVREGKYIFTYGGDDIEWIRRFTTTACRVAQSARVPLEMVYVGRSGKSEQVKRTITTITHENLSHCWQDLVMIWFFWTRVESMLLSKIKIGIKADGNDPIMQEIMRLNSFDGEGCCWAVLSEGSSMIASGRGATMLPALLEYDIWKEHVAVRGFDVAFKEHHDKIQGATRS